MARDCANGLAIYVLGETSRADVTMFGIRFTTKGVQKPQETEKQKPIKRLRYPAKKTKATVRVCRRLCAQTTVSSFVAAITLLADRSGSSGHVFRDDIV
ncbi:unnamed protein product [Macrosiphum euphorbiae]|uniref:Uncharacterized protein n=1 Tax=Macrosiphum euphorbiae TaxID=13131 RepID=A0AAV0VX91_9HEMI|nr:unnamed protein product [Macrosiphum euphorbiae]